MGAAAAAVSRASKARRGTSGESSSEGSSAARLPVARVELKRGGREEQLGRVLHCHKIWIHLDLRILTSGPFRKVFAKWASCN